MVILFINESFRKKINWNLFGGGFKCMHEKYYLKSKIRENILERKVERGDKRDPQGKISLLT